MPRLLVVDDDAGIRNLVSLIGKRKGFEVETASDGMQALDLVTHNSYDVAVIDLMMPRVNGYDLVAYMKRLPEKPFVVIVTAMTDTLVAQLDANIVQSIVRKPFDIDLLGGVLLQLAETMKIRRGQSASLESESPEGIVVPFPGRTAC
jgi:DNA-binding response OmpR family regulator